MVILTSVCIMKQWPRTHVHMITMQQMTTAAWTFMESTVVEVYVLIVRYEIGFFFFFVRARF